MSGKRETLDQIKAAGKMFDKSFKQFQGQLDVVEQMALLLPKDHPDRSKLIAVKGKIKKAIKSKDSGSLMGLMNDVQNILIKSAGGPTSN